MHGRGECEAGALDMRGGGGMHWGAWVAGGMGGGGCGVWMAGGMHGRGVYMAGRCTWQGGVHGRRDGHCSRRYASYWNAFLL